MLNDVKFKAATDLELSDYPEFCVWENSIVRTKILSMIWSLTGDRGVTILDVGCGAARMWQPLLENMPNVLLYGFDPGKNSIALAQNGLKGLKANVCQGSVASIDAVFPEVQAFDFIVSHSVLEHVVPRHLYFSAIANRLADDGTALISWGSDHFRQGLQTDLRNYVSQLLAIVGVERYYAREVEEQWARNEITKAGLEINTLHHYSLVELKKLFKLAPEESKTRIFQDWIRIEEEFNRGTQEDTSFNNKMDETFAVITKKDSSALLNTATNIA
jgi:SAM-dependent methyltransferase